MTVYYQGDKVIRAEATTTTLYKYVGVTNAREAEERFGYTSMYLGVTWKFDFQKDRYIMTTEIDLEKALQDKRNAFWKNPIWKDSLAEDGKSVSLEKHKKGLIAEGFEVIKNKKFQELPK